MGCGGGGGAVICETAHQFVSIFFSKRISSLPARAELWYLCVIACVQRALLVRT